MISRLNWHFSQLEMLSRLIKWICRLISRTKSLTKFSKLFYVSKYRLIIIKTQTLHTLKLCKNHLQGRHHYFADWYVRLTITTQLIAYDHMCKMRHQGSKWHPAQVRGERQRQFHLCCEIDGFIVTKGNRKQK